MVTRKFIVAIDRSTKVGVEVFAVIALSIDSQEKLIRYSDFFKHLRRLGRFSKIIYLPKMLRIIKQLVERRIIIGLKVFTRLNEAVELVHSRRANILACIVDNNTYNYYTTRGIKSSNYFKYIPLVILENELKKPSEELIDKVHRAGLTMVFLRTTLNISDNIASYTRNLFEKQLREIPQIWNL